MGVRRKQRDEQLTKQDRKWKRNSTKNLDEDGGKRMIYKMARDRNEKSKDVKRGSVIKDKNGTLITYHNEVLHVWETYFKEMLNN